MQRKSNETILEINGFQFSTDMRHCVLVACVMLGLMASVACAQGVMVSRGSARGDGMSFLKRAGVDLSQVERLPDVVDLSGDAIGYYPLDDQVHRLLEPVRHFSYYYEVTDQGIEGGYAIAGVRDYGDGRTLVLYQVEYGDGANVELASYNVRGDLVDFIDLGYGCDGMAYNTDDDPSSDVCVYVSRSLELPNDSVVVVRETQQVLPSGLSNWTEKDVLGRVDKTISYAYNSLGQLHLASIGSKHSGQWVEQSHRFEDIRDLHYYPVSQYERIGRLNQMAARPDVVSDMAGDEYSVASYELHHAAADMIQTNTIQVLLWMFRHRDNNLSKVMAQCARSGLIDVGMIRNEMERKAPNPAFRTVIGRELDKWSRQESE